MPAKLGKSSSQVAWLFLINGALGAMSLLFYLSIPSDAESAIVAGFSLSRLGLVLLISIASWGITTFGLKLRSDPLLLGRIHRKVAEPKIFWPMISVFFVVLLVGILYFLSPSYLIFKPLLGYRYLFIRFAVFIGWLTFTSLFCISELILIRANTYINRRTVFISIILFLLLCVYLISIGLGWAPTYFSTG